MALSFTGSGQFLSMSSALVSSYPMSMAAWVRTNTNNADRAVISVSDAGNTNVFMLDVNSGTPRASVKYQNIFAAASSNAGVLTLGTWYHLAAVFASPTSRIIYVNGVNSGSNANNGTPTGVNTSQIAALSGSIVFNGTIAYTAIWGNIALNATDINNLYNAGAGVDPSTIQSGSIVSFSLLQGSAPFPDSITSINWTVTGSPTVVADPFNISSSFPVFSGVGTRFGFATHFGQGWSTNLMPLIAATGATYIRDDLSSSGWEPTQGNFQISTQNKPWCDAAHANGLKVVGIISGNGAYVTPPPLIFVQSNSTQPTGATTITCSFTGAQTAGNINVVIIGWENAAALTVTSVSDNINGAYTPGLAQSTNGTINQRMYYRANILGSGAGANTVKVVLSGSASFPDLRILEYSGVDTISPVDVTATNNGASTASTVSVTTTNPNDVIVVGGTTANTFNVVTAPFTRRVLTSPNADIADDDIVSAIGTYTDAPSQNVSGSWVMQAIAFKRAPSDFWQPNLMAARAAFIAQSGLVDVIEVANEPNNAYQTYKTSIGRNWLTDLPILTTAITNAVHGVSSTVQVIGLGAQGSEIWGMYPATTLDGIVYHPYDTGDSKAAFDAPDTCFEQPSVVNSTSSLAYVPWINICRGQTSLPLWETEWGVQQPDILGGFTQDQQADYLVRRLLTSAGLAVENTFIYEFKDNSSTDLFGVYNQSGTTSKSSYASVTRLISALSGAAGATSSPITISNVASGSTNAMGYAYQGPGKTVASSWFGNASPASPEPASTCTIAFGTGLAYNSAVVLNPISGSSVPLTTFTVVRSGNQVTVSGLPISDHPLLIILTESTPPRFLQRAINHASGSGAISCPVTTSLTSSGNLMVVYIGTQATGSVISSVTDNKGNAYSLAYSNTAFNASLFCYHCLGCIAGVTTVTVLSSATVNSLNLDVAVYEFSAGVGSVWFFDMDASAGSNSGVTTAVSSSSTSVTTQVNEVAIAACAANGTTTTAGTGGGWTGVVAGLNGWSEYEIVSSAGTYAASFTVATTGHAWVAGIGTWYSLNSSFRTNSKAASASSSGVIVRQMAPITDAFVQQAENRAANSGAISCVATLTATKSGSLIVVYIGTLSAGSVITSVTDNKGNIYTLAFSDTLFKSSLFCYHCLGCISGVTSVTVLSSAAVNSNQLDVSVYEMSGVGTWSFDKFSVSGSNSGATTAATSGTTVSTTVSNEVIIGACFTNGTTVTAGTAGWTGQSG